jgi:hypothetical protein
MPDETEIQKLLRLKRYEQPSEQYFQTFLHDFHRRQRAELLRQPVWKIALERASAFFSEHSMGRYAYAGATAAMLFFAGIASVGILNSGGTATALVAENSAPAPNAAGQSGLTLNPNIALPNLNASFSQTAQTNAQITNPRYIIDARPVSYERPSSF